MPKPMTPPSRTVLGPVLATSCLWHAYQDVIGGPCPVNLIRVLGAHSAHETGRWKSMWNYNFGNIRGKSAAGEWTSIKGASEIEKRDGKDVEVFYDIGPDNMFASYSSPMEGARAYVRFLGTATKPPNPNRYAKAWDAATAGDVAAFCREIKSQGYFTANLQKYIVAMEKNLTWLDSEVMPEIRQEMGL